MAKYEQIAEQINDALNRDGNELLSFLRILIALPTETGKEEQGAKFVAETMKKAGFDEVEIDEMGSPIGRIGSGKKVIVFDAHLDTVEAGDPKDWGFDPFKGKEDAATIYGRGAVDDKGPLSAMIYAGKAIKSLGLDNHDFTMYVIGAVGEEDCEGLALQYFLDSKNIKPDYVVIGESSEMRICRGHRGRAQFEVTVPGRAGHASAPELADNSLYKAVDIINGVIKLQDQLKEDPFLGKGTIAVTKIESKSNSFNTIPGETVIGIDRRLTFGETREEALAQVEALAVPYGAKVEIMGYEAPSYNGFPKKGEEFFPAWTVEENSPVIQAGAEAYQALFKKDAVIGKWGFCTDGTYSAGVAGIPTIGFGPGEGKYCHTELDQVPKQEVIDAAKLYALLPIILSEKGGK